MAYSTIDKATLYANTITYSGTGADTNAITGVGFQPDFVWIKEKSSTSAHALYDVLRGTTKKLESDSSGPEQTEATTFASFDSDGFTVNNNGQVNESGQTYVGWNWKMGTASGITQGGASITPSSYSFNSTAKQSIIKYVGTGSVATVPHGLGVKPDIIIIKNLDAANEYWGVYNSVYGATVYAGYLNATNAKATTSVAWNDTEPTADVFTIGTEAKVNGNGDNMIAYCFANVPGYFTSGNYYGNFDANGPMIYTGFRPSLLIIKCTNDTGDWLVYDNKRLGYNENQKSLEANDTASESNSFPLNIYSNGFKCKVTGAGNDLNGNSDSYSWMAWGQSIVSSGNIVSTAR